MILFHGNFSWGRRLDRDCDLDAWYPNWKNNQVPDFRNLEETVYGGYSAGALFACYHLKPDIQLILYEPEPPPFNFDVWYRDLLPVKNIIMIWNNHWKPEQENWLNRRRVEGRSFVTEFWRQRAQNFTEIESINYTTHIKWGSLGHAWDNTLNQQILDHLL